jgi:hypothetical protein
MTKPRIGDDAVRGKTGRTWKQWFAILDRAGATAKPHREIALLLREKHGLPHWWSQEVTVEYERARGLREKHEKPGGFEVSGSKTIGVPVAKLWRAWNHKRWLARWLPDDPFEVRVKTKERSMRITWADGTHVDVNFYVKGDAKTQVGVQHKKLADARAAEKAKAFWKERLGVLKETLEG